MEKEKFILELVNLENQFSQVKKFDNYRQVKDYSTEAMQLRERLELANEKTKSFNEREALFKLPLTEY